VLLAGVTNFTPPEEVQVTPRGEITGKTHPLESHISVVSNHRVISQHTEWLVGCKVSQEEEGLEVFNL